MELTTISAFSETGFSDPKYSTALPQSLADAGLSQDSWTKFIVGANEAVKFEWGIGTICCFFCNSHNKKVARNMEMFCQDNQALFPSGVRVSYKMVTEKKITQLSDSTGSAATLETFHNLIFTRA